MRRADEWTPGSQRDLRVLREKTLWEVRARKALDTWGPTSETSVATAIETAYVDGLKRAATFLEEKGQRELAAMVRALAEERK
jgi:hypothetical protein